MFIDFEPRSGNWIRVNSYKNTDVLNIFIGFEPRNGNWIRVKPYKNLNF